MLTSNSLSRFDFRLFQISTFVHLYYRVAANHNLDWGMNFQRLAASQAWLVPFAAVPFGFSRWSLLRFPQETHKRHTLRTETECGAEMSILSPFTCNWSQRINPPLGLFCFTAFAPCRPSSPGRRKSRQPEHCPCCLPGPPQLAAPQLYLGRISSRD
jgi:hypothetical protein